MSSIPPILINKEILADDLGKFLAYLAFTNNDVVWFHGGDHFDTDVLNKILDSYEDGKYLIVTLPETVKNSVFLHYSALEPVRGIVRYPVSKMEEFTAY